MKKNLTYLQLINASILLLVIFVFSSCSSGPYTPKSEAGKPEARGLPLVFLDKDVRRTVSVDVPVTSTRTAAGHLQVQVPFRNRTNDEVVSIQVQTLFRNSAGMVLYAQPGNEPAWKSLTMTPNQSAYYQQSSLSPEAVTFTIRVRYQARPN